MMLNLKRQKQCLKEVVKSHKETLHSRSLLEFRIAIMEGENRQVGVIEGDVDNSPHIFNAEVFGYFLQKWNLSIYFFPGSSWRYDEYKLFYNREELRMHRCPFTSEEILSTCEDYTLIPHSFIEFLGAFPYKFKLFNLIFKKKEVPV